MPRHDLDPQAHYLHNAATLAFLTDAAYVAEQDEMFQSLCRQTNVAQRIDTFSLPRHDDDQAPNNPLGFVASNDQQIVLAFRGTEDWADVLTDIDMLPQIINGARVHGGFAADYQAVARDILRLLDKHRADEKYFWITGHSLGGALATLAAAYLQLPDDRHAVFTYGQPAVGDRVFSKQYRRAHHRFVNDQDPVTLVPPQIPLGNWIARLLRLLGWKSSIPELFETRFVHVGRVIHFDDAGHLVKGMPEAVDLMRELRTVLFSRDDLATSLKDWLVEKASDHRMSHYVERCQRAAESLAPSEAANPPKRRAA